MNTSLDARRAKARVVKVRAYARDRAKSRGDASPPPVQRRHQGEQPPRRLVVDGDLAIQSRLEQFGAFVTRIVGSYPAIVGLPLHETVNLLAGAGWKPE